MSSRTFISSDPYDDLAAHAAILHVAQRRFDVAEAVSGADVRVELATREQIEDLGLNATDLVGHLRGIEGPLEARDGDVLEQDVFRLHRGDRPASETHDNQTAAERQGAEACFENVAANRFDDEIGEPSAGRARDLVLQPTDMVLVVDADDRVGPRGLDDLALVRRRYTSDHGLGAQRLGEPDRSETDAAGGTVHQYDVVGRHLAALAQGEMRRLIRQSDRRGSFERNRCWNRETSCGGRVQALGEGSKLDARQHAVADLEVLYVGADGAHGTCAFHAGSEGHRRLDLIGAFGHQNVGEIHARCAYVDLNLASAGGSDGGLADTDRVDTGRGVDQGCSHAAVSLFGFVSMGTGCSG